MQLSPQAKTKLIQFYPELRTWFDAQDKHEELKKIASEAPKLPPEILAKIKAVKGEKGDKGDPGKDGKDGNHGRDYRTDEGFNEMLKKVTPIKGIHYHDGKDGRNGINGKDGKKGERGMDGIGIRGRDGRDGKNGKDAIIPKDIVPNVIKELKGKKLLSSKDIDMSDMRWHGGGLSKVITDSTLTGQGTGASPLSVVNSSSITFVMNEIVSGSGATFTLANTPVALSVAVYIRGQRALLGTDYTISGKIITTTNSLSASDLIADYRK